MVFRSCGSQIEVARKTNKKRRGYRPHRLRCHKHNYGYSFMTSFYSRQHESGFFCSRRARYFPTNLFSVSFLMSLLKFTNWLKYSSLIECLLRITKKISSAKRNRQIYFIFWSTILQCLLRGLENNMNWLMAHNIYIYIWFKKIYVILLLWPNC